MASGPGSGQAVGVAATSTRRAGDNPEEWAAWVREACAAVGVDPATVDVDAILDLTSQVAHRYARPMAPVAAYILGGALGKAGAGADRATLAGEIVDSLPAN